jgi:F-type H+-transporting ATPase subunit a
MTATTHSQDDLQVARQEEITTSNTEQVVTEESTTGTNTEATTENSVSHEITLFAEPIFHVGSFTITNSLISSWTVVFILAILAIIVGRKIKKIPKGLQNVFEIIIENAIKLMDSVTNSSKKSKQIFPYIFTIFIFILFNNWLGLIPGVGSIGFIETGHEGSIFVPFFRGATADLNTTLALAIFSVLAANIFGILTIGGWNFFNKFINVKALAAVPMHIRKEPSIIIVNPIKFFVGLIEIIGEVAKVASLSFRLFGNVFAGEVLLASMAAIFAFVVPIPFIFLEIIVGVIQALIFSMLTLVYFTIASSAEEH